METRSRFCIEISILDIGLLRGPLGHQPGIGMVPLVQGSVGFNDLRQDAEDIDVSRWQIAYSILCDGSKGVAVQQTGSKTVVLDKVCIGHAKDFLDVPAQKGHGLLTTT
jgi:hypothetical protein